MKKTDMLFGAYFIIGLIVFFTLTLFVQLSKEDIKNVIEIVLNTSSIIMGFFATVFTFIFGLKDNYIHNEIMKSHSKKRQYKFLNNCIIVMGFLQIVLSFIIILLLTMKNSKSEFVSDYLKHFLHFNITQYSFNIVLAIVFMFFLFFATYLLLILNLVFRSNDNNSLPQKEMPEIKNKKI